LIQKIHELARMARAKLTPMQQTRKTKPPALGSNPQCLPATIRLQAIDPARNIARDYHIDASPDLFGHWIISLRWGRIGTKGQSRVCSFAEQHAAARFVRHTLRRRASAQRRIGVAYGPAPNSELRYAN
jgi:predicted DNA-binding WGR domain protein